jgi:hypothetical protein
VAKLAQGKNRASLLLWIKELVKTVHGWSNINTFTIKVNYCGLSYGAWLECFPVNATLEAESDLYQLSYLSLPIHISAKAIQAGGPVDLDGYKLMHNEFWKVMCCGIVYNCALCYAIFKLKSHEITLKLFFLML